MPVCQLGVHRVEGSGSPHVDRSKFVGLRKPTVGRIERDPVAQRLAKVYSYALEQPKG